jgi:hypothetical protein
LSAIGAAAWAAVAAAITTHNANVQRVRMLALSKVKLKARKEPVPWASGFQFSAFSFQLWLVASLPLS